MPLKTKNYVWNCDDQFDCIRKSVTWVTLRHMWGGLCIKTAYIIQFLSHGENPWHWKRCLNDRAELVEVIHLFEQQRTLESPCTYRTPFYSCFCSCSLSGPFTSYACRSCWFKLVQINCILWKSAPCTSEMYYSLFAFFFFFSIFGIPLKSICQVFICHKESTALFCKQTFVSLV